MNSVGSLVEAVFQQPANAGKEYDIVSVYTRRIVAIRNFFIYCDISRILTIRSRCMLVTNVSQYLFYIPLIGASGAGDLLQEHSGFVR